MRLCWWIMSVLFPGKCVLCRGLLKKGETDLCGICRVETAEYVGRKTKPQFLDSFAAVWYYEKNVRNSLLRYKFHGSRHYAAAYGRCVAMRLLREAPDREYDLVTWVPVSFARRLCRGYDQAELLAKAVGRELGVETVSVIKKIRHNRKQSHLTDYSRRRANVLGAYRVKEPERIREKRILLVDDVLTTGATAGECARVLLTAGAREVHCAAVAAPRKR